MNLLKKRDEILNNEMYLRESLGREFQLLLTMQSRLRVGEVAAQFLQVGDIWKYEIRVTKLREPLE